MSTNSWIVTAAEMRDIEARAVALGEITLEALMENAGRAVFEKVLEVCPSPARLGIYCGKGNNGGDGFVVARLAQQAGFQVACIVAADLGQLGDLCRLQMERAKEAGATIVWHDEGAAWGRASGSAYDLRIDALLGTGLSGEPTGPVAEGIGDLRKFGWQVLAIDVPSGLDADTGQELGVAVQATWTVCLGLAKPYLFHDVCRDLVGEWAVVDIGLPHQVRSGAKLANLAELKPPERGRQKGDNGHVLIVAGSSRYRGAATLATLGALRAGAGLVTVAAIEPVIQAVAAQVPEAIFLPLPEENGAIATEAAQTLKIQMGKVTSAVFGPGLTTANSVRSFLQEVWRDWWTPSVIDADALNLVAEGLPLPPGLNILTPHPGEAARLLKTETKVVQSDRFTAARGLLSRYGWPVVLKGAYTVSAIADQPLFVNPTGNAGMATGGMGDVLSGVIAALLSADPNPHVPLAGVTGAYWHGLAGDLCAKELGEIGFSASDLAHFLPRARSILST
ncbi:MAG: NAD(P)H-hydrate dehydratase [Armatimonadetes bacterium]|nr:NAD(P)H-hydrate dehydratase [Armatimonadota bacterium]